MLLNKFINYTVTVNEKCGRNRIRVILWVGKTTFKKDPSLKSQVSGM